MRTTLLRFQHETELPAFLAKNKIPRASDKVLIQIFTGIVEQKFLANLQKIFAKLLPKAGLIGTTACSEIYKDKVLTKETVIAFTVFEQTHVRAKLFPHQAKTSNNYSFLTGQKVARQLLKPQTKVLISFGDGLTTNGEEFLQGLQKISPQTIIAGGLAGDDLKFKKTFVFTKNKLTSSGVVAAALDNPKLIANTFYTLNWQNIGKLLTITKVKKNQVAEIDHTPIIDIYRKYFGAEAVDEIANKIGIEFPLIFYRNGIKIARAALKRNKNNSLSFSGNLQAGEKVQFGYGNAAIILQNSINFYEKIKKIPLESLFIYSCVARKNILGQAVTQEIAPLNRLAETSGFFTYGEFFHHQREAPQKQPKGFNELLNETMTVLALSENAPKK